MHTKAHTKHTMINLNLPNSTSISKTIPKDKLFLHTITTAHLREIYSEQIESVVWRSKLSTDTLGIKAEISFNELEVFDISLKSRLLDKRLLHQIDKGIPYYIFHILNFDGKYQAWIANKRNYNGKIKVENYFRTLWLSEQEFTFSFDGSTIDGIYSGLKEQIEEKRKRKIIKSEQLEECSAFMHYFRTMKMTRSYKPVLILATLQAGGSITVEQAAYFFVKFYRNRKSAGLKPEAGSCIYADEPDNLKAIHYNLIHNPIDALCHSGFFEYDAENKIFSFSNDIYDGLTLDEVDEIGNVCNIRLQKYFKDTL